MQILKGSFYFINILLFIFYLFPGSVLGCLFINDCDTQPQLTRNFIFISSNHLYVFLLISLLGIFLFNKKLKKILIYLFSISIILELLHLIIPKRDFDIADLLGNIIGVMLSLILFKLFIFRRLK